MNTYKITAVRGRKVVELQRDLAVDAFRAASRLRELGWEVRVSR